MENNYIKSNQILTIKYKTFAKRYLSNVYRAENDINKRYDSSRELLNYLCGKMNIPNVELVVLDKNRKKNNNKEIHGFYVKSGRKDLSKIVIYNRTAVRGNIISINQYIDTLLHEFMHHYDFNVIKLSESLHTSAFYNRINDLKNKL